MDGEVQVVISPDIYIVQIKALQRKIESLEKENSELKIKLKYERELRENIAIVASAEQEETPKKTRKKREVSQESHTYSDFKSNGIRKPHAADSIRSYNDFKAIQDYYLSAGKVRDWAMWTVGVSLGLRVSDLLSLKWNNVLSDNKKDFLQRIKIYEFKTGKLQNCLITESVRQALTEYLSSLNWQVDLDGYIFPSKKTNGKMYEECGWRILSEAGKALKLPIVVGSHTMRKSFANIAACVDRSSIDMNSITKVQGLLNHSDQTVTMKYLGSYQEMFDRARIAVSDFVLGKTDVGTIVAGNQFTTDDIVERLDALEKLLYEKKE